MKKSVIAGSELLTAMVIVGSTVVVGKMIVNKLPVFISQSLSYLIALAILIPIVIKREGGTSLKNVGKKDWIVLFFQALTGSFLFRALLLYGLKYTTASESGIILSTTPAMIAVISWLFLKEQFNGYKILGIAASVSGVLMINSAKAGSLEAGGFSSLFGYLLMLTAVCSEALFTILRKVASETVTPAMSAAINCLFALILYLPFSVIEGMSFNMASLSLADYLPVIYYGTVGTVAAYLLWFDGVSKVSAGVAAAYTGVMPVSSVLLSGLILKEALMWQHFVGMLLAICGIMLIQSKAFSSPESAEIGK